MTGKLKQEEKEILKSYDDEWAFVSNSADLARYKLAAKNIFKKDKRVNFRMSEMDLELLHTGTCAY